MGRLRKQNPKLVPARSKPQGQTKDPGGKDSDIKPLKGVDDAPSFWYSSTRPLEPLQAPAEPCTPEKLASLTSRATDLHAKDVATFQSSSSSSSEASFLAKIIQSGTLSDRLSALTLLVQSSPVHNIKALETLRTMAERGKGKGGREESLKALRCIVDWWVGGGTPDRKLKYFRDQPLSHPDRKDEHLVIWYFEDWLKKYFFSVLQILENLLLDPLTYVRTQALNLVSSLLREKPEQEHNLLRLLVNKLGDTEKSICSRASYQLLQLLQAHPSMKSIIVREMSSLVLRPSASLSGSGSGSSTQDSHIKYYATITFNQIVLTHADKELAQKLLDLYFETFKDVLGNASASKADLANSPDGVKSSRFDGKGRVKESTRRKGKGKEVKGAAGFAETEDDSSKLITAILTGVNRALPFAKLDAGDIKLNKHIETLFLITHKSTFNISLQALVLIQHITESMRSSLRTAALPSSSVSRTIIDRFYRTLYASLFDPRLASSSKQAMYLNLLFKSIKADDNAERVRGMTRRFVQVLSHTSANEFLAGGLYLLGELFSTVPGLKTMLGASVAGDDLYDPRKRDPQYSSAYNSALVELHPLINHYHPSISLHASQLLSSHAITTSADLSLNTLSHFLDRFVYKNPKKDADEQSGKGASAMQPAASGYEGGGIKIVKGKFEPGRMNEEAFIRRKEENIPADQVFFHRFFTRKAQGEQSRSRKKKRAIREVSEDEDGESEVEIWKAMKASMPDIPGDDNLSEDSDSDDGVSLGFDSFEGDESDEDYLPLAEGSDDANQLSTEGDKLDDLLDFDEDGNNSDISVWSGIDGESRKRKHDDKLGESRKKRKPTLPTFASYDEYAKLIEEGSSDDTGKF